MKTPRLAYVSQWFTPESVGPPLWVARAMRERGFNVQVATGIPNYPDGVVEPGYQAHVSKTEIVDGFKVLRSPLYPSHNHSAVGRMLNYGSFAITTCWYATPALKTADVTLVYASPATASLPAMLARKRFGTPYVLYIQDLWPDSIFATGFLTASPAKRVAEAGLVPFLRSMYKNAAHIAVITEGMKNALADRGVPLGKISVVYNWADERVFRPVEPNGKLRRLIGVKPNDLILAYAGNLGNAQGLNAWIDAMALVQDLPSVHLALVGEGTQKEALQKQAESLELDRVHFLDSVPSSQVAELVSDADALVISLADDPLFEITMPGKTQTCLAQGKAILASASGEVARAIHQSEGGWSAEPENKTAVALMIRQAHAAGRVALREHGERARSFYLSKMGKDVGSARLDTLLRDAVNTR